MRSRFSAVLFLAAGLVAFTPPRAHAETIDLKPPVSAEESHGDANYLLFATPAKGPSVARGLASAATCTDDRGVIFQKGAVGYEACRRTENLTKPERVQPGQWGNTLNIFGK